MKLSKVIRVLATNETTYETRDLQVLQAEVNHCEIKIPESFSHPVDNSFNFSHETTKACVSKDSTIIVKSARSNFERRESMRNQLKDINFHGDVFFIVGQERESGSTYDATVEIVQKDIREEFSSKRDIIFGNFVDSYNNLTMKSRSALSFYLDRCKSDLLFLIDDDALIKYPAIFKFHKSSPIKWSIQLPYIIK